MDNYPPVEPVQPKSGSKLPLILGIIAGVLLLCCCAGIIVAIATNSVSNVFGGIQNGLESTQEPSYDESGGGSTSGPVGPAIGGRGNDILKGDVWNAIVIYEASQGCDSPVSTAISVTQDPDSDGAWVEAWEVDSCGQSTTYIVRLTPDPAGGINYEITK